MNTDVLYFEHPLLETSVIAQSNPHQLGMNYYVNFLGHLGSNGFQLMPSPSASPKFVLGTLKFLSIPKFFEYTQNF